MQSIIKEGVKQTAMGVNPMGIRLGIEAGANAVVKALKDISKPIKSKSEIEQVATISAESKEIGKIIADTIDKVGKDGVVTVEEAQSMGVSAEFVEGLQFDRGFVSSYMITDLDRMEAEYKEKGKKMIQNVIDNKGPLAHKTVKFYSGDFIPNIYLSESDNIILCGLVDWVEYLEETDSLRVIDFKTGKNEEKEDSYQLPIYKILVEALQKRKVTGAAYWYLDRDRYLSQKEILDEDLEEIKKEILKIGIEIKTKKERAKSKAEMEQHFTCKREGGCFACREFELIRNFTFNTDEIEAIKNGSYILGDSNSSKREQTEFIEKLEKLKIK
jgi:hypothetical protein